MRMNAKYTACFTVAAALTLGGCAENVPELVRLSDGRLVTVFAAPAGEATPLETTSEALTSGSTTNPWEPGAGYFAQDESDPENRVYYDSCSADLGSQLDVVTVSEVLVFPETSEMQIDHIVVEVPDDGIDRFFENGEPLAPGHRTEGSRYAYSGSYANCHTSDSELDFGPILGIDARIVFSGECHQYFDYGQDRYRTLYHSARHCEGEDCDDPFVGMVIGVKECATGGMRVHRRVPEPTFD